MLPASPSIESPVESSSKPEVELALPVPTFTAPLR
jgi:hypothetical protein